LELSVATLVALGAADTSKTDYSWLIYAGLVGATLVCAFSVILSPAFNRERISQSPLRWIGLWLAWAAGSALLAPKGPTAVLTVGIFAVLAAGVVSVHGQSGEMGVARVILIAFAGFVSMSLVLMALDASVVLPRQSGRLALLALEANQLVRMAAIAVVASLYVIWASAKQQRWHWLAFGAVAGAASMAIVLAGQGRTGTAALIGSIAAFLMALVPGHKRPLVTVAGAVVFIGGLAIASSVAGGIRPLYEDFESVASRGEVSEDTASEIGSLNGRLDIWPEILSQAKLEPVSGHGLGNDREVVSQLYADGRIGWEAMHTHNLGLQVLLTTGVVGLILIFIAIVATAARAYDAHGPFGPALLVLILIDGVSEAAIRVPSFGWLALVAAAAMTAGPSGQLSEENTLVTRSSISSTARS
jgi:O-antigen ligase